MKGIKPIIISREKALKEWKKCIELLRERKEKHIEELRRLYYHASKGKKIIDVYEAMKFAGLNEKEEPKLAIARADLKTINFKKESNGAGNFCSITWKWKEGDVYFPIKTFPNFKLKENSTWEVAEPSNILTNVPIIPASKMPKGKLSNYHILWEVDKWENIPKDPILLRRITKNLFIVEATFNLTKLEQALIRGR
jgi:hypothetical protein